MEIIERIQKIMEREGLNVASFARRIASLINFSSIVFI